MTLNLAGDINADGGLKNLNTYLENRSYVEGWTASSSDVALFEAISKAPCANKWPHVRRWHNQIASYSGEEKKKLPGVAKTVADFGGTSSGKAPAAAAAAAADDDDVDLFGSDDDEVADAAREERLKAYAEKKAVKPGPIAKSNVILDVKPWDDETDMKAIEAAVRGIIKEGLVWGASKFVPMAYGIKKLTIVAVVVDDLVSIDWLTEEIQSNEELVQSVDIAAFQKI